MNSVKELMLTNFGRSVGRLIGLIGVIRKFAIQINKNKGFYWYLCVLNFFIFRIKSYFLVIFFQKNEML